MWSDFPQNTNSVLWEITRANESNVHFCWRSTFQCYFLQSQAGPCCAPGRNAFYVWSFLSPAAFHRIHGSPECHISIHHLVFIANTGCCQRAIKQQWFAIVIAYIMDKKRSRGRESESKFVVVQEALLLYVVLWPKRQSQTMQLFSIFICSFMCLLSSAQLSKHDLDHLVFTSYFPKSSCITQHDCGKSFYTVCSLL